MTKYTLIISEFFLKNVAKIILFKVFDVQNNRQHKIIKMIIFTSNDRTNHLDKRFFESSSISSFGANIEKYYITLSNSWNPTINELIWNEPYHTSLLLLNLIKNAIVHNRRGGEVMVTVSKSAIVMQNTGRDKPLDPQKIFSRFQKDSDSAHSTGLGLAIVQAIADLYQFQLSYHYQQYHTWTIQF